MTLVVARNYAKQFNQARKLMRLATRDHRITRQESREILDAKWDTTVQSLILDTLQAPNVKQRYQSNFEGKENPSGYDLREIAYRGDRSLGVDTLHQGSLGTCAILAVAVNGIDYVLNPNRTVTFRFFDRTTLQPEYVTVRENRPVNGASGFAGIVEKAYGLWRDREGAVTPGMSAWQDVTTGNTMEEVIQDMTGQAAVSVYANPAIADLAALLDQGKRVLVANWQTNSDYLAANHAYRIIGMRDQQVTLFNPWGFDGLKASGDPSDGLLTLDYGTLTQNLPNPIWVWES